MNNFKYASRSKRILNGIIDGLIILIIWGTLVISFAPKMMKMGLFDWMEEGKTYDLSYTIAPIHFLYYLILEGFFKTTIGKIITRTKLIKFNGAQIHFGDALARTIYRYIPFDPLTYLSEHPVGIHDSLSNTRLLNKNSKQSIS